MLVNVSKKLFGKKKVARNILVHIKYSHKK